MDRIIIIRDCAADNNPEIKRCYSQKEAEDFIENHERPEDLDCDFQPY